MNGKTAIAIIGAVVAAGIVLALIPGLLVTFNTEGAISFLRGQGFIILAAGETVNTDLIPDGDGTRDVGSASAKWAEGWFDDLFITNGVAGVVDNQAELNLDLTVTGTDATLHEIKAQIDGNDLMGWAATGDGAASVTGLVINSYEDLLFVNDKRLTWDDNGGTPRDVLWMDATDLVHLDSSQSTLAIQRGVNQGISAWGTTAGTGLIFDVRATDADAGNPLRDTPKIRLGARYWSGAANTAWNYDILHDMQTAAGTPKSQAIHSINGVDILTLENDNGTTAIEIAGQLEGDQIVAGGTVALTSAFGFTSIASADSTRVGLVLQNPNVGTSAGQSMIWNLSDDGSNAKAAGQIIVNKTGSWTTTGSTQDADMVFNTAVNGSLTEYARFRGDTNQDVLFGKTVNATTVTTLITNVGQDGDPGTSTDGEIRLWKDTNAGGTEGRIRFQVGTTSYTVNADAGITLYDQLGYQVANNNPVPLGPDETRDYRTGEKLQVGDTVMMVVDRDGTVQGQNGEYDFIHLVPVKVDTGIPVVLVVALLTLTLCPSALAFAWLWRKYNKLSQAIGG